MMNLQVGHLGADYDEWVHQPVLRKEESPKFFENDLLEVRSIQLSPLFFLIFLFYICIRALER
jgi:hypothetical protein